MYSHGKTYVNLYTSPVDLELVSNGHSNKVVLQVLKIH
jgi:hypothetical protein